MAGLCYLSGTWRLLVPEAAESLLAEMRAGKRAMNLSTVISALLCEPRHNPALVRTGLTARRTALR